jgi:hypothetical protein
MFDYRLFFAGSTLDNPERERRRLSGHEAKRIFQLPSERREQRVRGRR